MKTKAPTKGSAPGKNKILVPAVWLSLLLVSDLPDIILHGAGVSAPGWLFEAKLVFLAVFLGLCLAWKPLKQLWHFSLIMLVFFASLGLSDLWGKAGFWKKLFGGTEPTFTLGYLGFHIRDLTVAGMVIIALFAIRKKRENFFLVKGRLYAPVEPVRWLGIKSKETWKTFGWIFGGSAALAVLVVVMLSIRLSLGTIGKALPYLPLSLLLSCVNAFAEEVYFRLAPLSTLHGPIGKTHALLATSVFFGLGHFLYGSPPGIVGFLMTGFLGWIMGKSILETRGMFWAWAIHVMADFFIFFSYALAWVSR